jgi:rhamnosyltransferase
MPETNGPIPKHIQSYFLCFKKTVVQSPVFYRFWDDVEYEIEVETVIQKYKTLLTFILHKAGFSYLVLFELQPTLQQLDPSLYHPDICLKHNIPLVKVKSFLFFPMPQYITRLIQEKSDYPVSLIYDYFAEIYNPNVSLMIGDRLIPARLGTKSISSKLKIAIHLHVFYLDVFEKYIVCFDNYTIDFDLLITTDTAEKKH